MKTLEQCYEDIAVECGYTTFDALLEEIKGDAELIEFYIRIVSRYYAEQAIDKCANEASLILDEEDPYRVDDYPEHQRECLGDGRDGNILVYINRQSILSVKQHLQ